MSIHALAHNLGNFMRALAMPKTPQPWSLTSLKVRPPWHLRAVHQRGQGRDQMDPAVMPVFFRQRSAPPAPI